MRGRSNPRALPQDTPREEEVSLSSIAEKLDRLTWRRKLWGVDEGQVWHVVRRLDEMYRQLYQEQRIHYEALLEQERGKTSHLHG